MNAAARTGFCQWFGGARKRPGAIQYDLRARQAGVDCRGIVQCENAVFEAILARQCFNFAGVAPGQHRR